MAGITRCPKCGLSYIGFACPQCAGVQPEPASSPLKAGDRCGKYEILDVLGRGGMGTVYRARDGERNRDVALKLLSRECSQVVKTQQRFEREAGAMASLSHPNIVSVFESGREGDVYFIAMELVDGTDLRRRLKAEKRLPLPEALRMIGQICDALEVAHVKGIVHRDIKPENILLDKSSNVQIADFGLAKLTGTDRPQLSLTASGAAVGTAGYMAPEQLEDSRTVNHRADLYAAGVVLYEMLMGDIPLDASDRTAIDPKIDAAVAQAIERDPDKRFASAAAFRSALLGEATNPRRRGWFASLLSRIFRV